MSSPSLLLPGQPLPAQLITPPLPKCGKGCYERNGQIVASVVGRPRRDGAVVSVVGREETVGTVDVDSIVIGVVSVPPDCNCKILFKANSQISRLTPQQAHVTLTTLADRPLPESSEDFTGLIRIADIRLTERDKVKMGECFRLGDIVKAKVLSLGDARSYYLSTAANELGVVYAKSEAGNPLLPVSYQEMEDEVTRKKEKRKVAKPEGI
ncbi:exosome complex component CSL4 [Cryptococcus neoformans Bt1]|nr:exosome complex component CSL4 [Cryptococcus neoformans var. grubii Bt1]